MVATFRSESISPTRWTVTGRRSSASQLNHLENGPSAGYLLVPSFHRMPAGRPGIRQWINKQRGTGRILEISMTEQYCSPGREPGGVSWFYHRPTIGNYR